MTLKGLRKSRTIGTAILAAALLVSCDKSATPVSQGGHTGQIQTMEGQALPGATLFVIDPADFSIQAKTKTNSQGRFFAALEKAGPWWIGIQAPSVAHIDTGFVFGAESIITAQVFPGDVQQVEDLPGAEPQSAAAKVLNQPTLIGDLNQDGSIDADDVLILLGYVLDSDASGLTADFNEDGTVNWTDMTLLGNYLINGVSEFGIGTEAVDLMAELTPDLSDFRFLPDGQWHTFAVSTTADSLLVRVNGPGTDVVLEIAGGSRPPTRNYCGPEANDNPRRPRRNNWNLHLAGCLEGSTEVVVMDYQTQNVLKTYPVTVYPDLVDSVAVDSVAVTPIDSVTVAQDSAGVALADSV